MRGAKSKKLGLKVAQICVVTLVLLATFFLIFGRYIFGPLPQWTVWFVIIVYGGVGILIGIGVILLIIKKLGRRTRREE